MFIRAGPPSVEFGARVKQNGRVRDLMAPGTVRPPDPRILIIRSGPLLRRICRRSCAKRSNERFHGGGDSFDKWRVNTCHISYRGPRAYRGPQND